jgi:uncharacterized repeat protein (TIGR03803 family)
MLTRTRIAVVFVISLFTALVGTESLDAQTFTTIHSFSGSPDGSGPADGLTRGPNGSFFGTTESGGDFGAGTVFKLNREGQVHVLYSFCPVTNCVGDGSAPFGSVVLDDSGNIYGTTFSAAVGLFGIVFKIDPQGNETVLHSFSGLPTSDGANPGGTLLRDPAGNLYGTTEGGGLLCSQSISGCGTIFKIDSSGKETILYRFTGGGDGGIPGAGVIRDAAGSLYGTTYVGGSAECGTVYKVSISGKETVLHSFNCSNGDGSGPLSGLIRDRRGALYGTTGSGGVFGQGTVFKVTLTGKETVLYSFGGGTTDGCQPYYGSLTFDEVGNLYGTTVFCGTDNTGVVFRIDPSGNEIVLHSFTGGADGSNPYGGTLIDIDGNLYGMTFGGGDSNAGVIYKLLVPGLSGTPAVTSRLRHIRAELEAGVEHRESSKP